MSSLKVEKEPNDDKTILFDSTSKTLNKRNNKIEGPIRQHIRQVNEKIKNRMLKAHQKKTENHMNKFDKCNIQRNQISKRHRRMKFMGIPVQQTPFDDFSSMKVSHSDLNAIVAKVSKPSLLLLSREISSDDKSTPERKHLNAKFPPQVAMLKPKIPEFDCKVEEERERLELDKFAPFKKAQPRGTNVRNLRADKSLPWIEDELNSMKIKLQKDSKKERTFNDEISESRKTTGKARDEKEENSNALKKSFNEIIAKKLQDYNPPNKNETDQDSESSLRIQSIESSSSLSSTGTNFTNDSGSVLMFQDKSIPTREMNAEKKFLVRFSILNFKL